MKFHWDLQETSMIKAISFNNQVVVVSELIAIQRINESIGSHRIGIQQSPSHTKIENTLTTTKKQNASLQKIFHQTMNRRVLNRPYMYIISALYFQAFRFKKKQPKVVVKHNSPLLGSKAQFGCSVSFVLFVSFSYRCTLAVSLSKISTGAFGGLEK